MTLALRLREAGFSLTLIEAAKNTGGLASSCKIGTYRWDRFYHVMLLSDSNLMDLLDQLKLTDQIHWGKTKTGFFTGGHLYSMSNTLEFLTFPPLKLLDKIRLGWTIFYASRLRSWERLETILVTDWLKRISGERTFNEIWLPLLKSKLGENYKIVSASFIWAAISRMYGARRSGQKKEQLGYVDGGYATVLDRFKALLDTKGIETLCRTNVTNIQNNNEGVRVATGTRRSLEFDELILTIPCPQIPGICPHLSLSEQKRFRNITYQGVLCAALILKKPLAGYYVTNLTDEWVPFTGVIEMTALVNKDYFDGNSLVYLPRYLIEGDPFWQKNEGEIENEFLSALESMYPAFRRDDVLCFKISRAGQVHPITTLQYSTQLLPPTKTSLDHIFVVNSAQIPNGTMNLNEIVGLANRQAKQITELLSK